MQVTNCFGHVQMAIALIISYRSCYSLIIIVIDRSYWNISLLSDLLWQMSVLIHFSCAPLTYIASIGFIINSTLRNVAHVLVFLSNDVRTGINKPNETIFLCGLRNFNAIRD